jgi:hypothetical protein
MLNVEIYIDSTKNEGETSIENRSAESLGVLCILSLYKHLL